MNVYLGMCLYEFNFLLNFRKAVNSCVFVGVDVVVSKMIDHNTLFPKKEDTQKMRGKKCV